jgi:hypothetical protein
MRLTEGLIVPGGYYLRSRKSRTAAQAFDRARRAERWLRIHQEDLCQALGVHPSRKYQHDGGPGPKAIVELIRNHSSAPNDDVVTFVDALAFNWLIAGTDAHASCRRRRLSQVYIPTGIDIAAGRKADHEKYISISRYLR